MMMDRRQRLAEIFQDTVRWYTEDPDLIAASRMSYQLTRLYQPDEYPDLPDNPQKTCQVIVSPQRTFEAAAHAKAKNPSSRIAVLNFASAVKPGGGVVHGSSAQEECLCRCSTLYYALDNKMLWANYYNVNRAAQNGCIRTLASIHRVLSYSKQTIHSLKECRKNNGSLLM